MSRAEGFLSWLDSICSPAPLLPLLQPPIILGSNVASEYLLLNHPTHLLLPFHQLGGVPFHLTLGLNADTGGNGAAIATYFPVAAT